MRFQVITGNDVVIVEADEQVTRDGNLEFFQGPKLVAAFRSFFWRSSMVIPEPGERP